MTEVVTGEAVILDVPCARFPSRIAALLIDLLLQVVLLVAVLIAIFFSVGDISGATGAGIFLSSYVVIVVGYSAIFETLTRGKTPGKMALGLRVISDDGGPVRFRQALVRALTGAIEIWTVIGAPVGLLLSLVSAKGKRLGDMFAGTYVIQERAPRRPDLPPMFATVPPPLLGWAQVVETSRLTDQTAEAAGSYLRRFHELSPTARDDLGLRIASAMVAQVSPPPPPGTPPPAYLAAVLAIRREREHARLIGQRPGPADGTVWPPAQAHPAAMGWAAPAPTTGSRPTLGAWGAWGAPAPPAAAPAAPAAPATWTSQAPTTDPNQSTGQTGQPAQDQPAQTQSAQDRPAQDQPAQTQPAQTQPRAGQPASGGFAPPA